MHSMKTKLDMSKRFAITLMLVSILASAIANAAKPVYSGGRDRAAIRGYDPVAYFTQGQPVMGSKEFILTHKGAKWMFSSQANLETFKGDPDKYMPQYGGYCAYAVSNGSTASSKPEFFTVHEGKLYLNYSKSVYKKWLKDKSGYIDSADKEWPEIIKK